MISLFDIWIILNNAKIIINARNQQGRCRSYEVVNLDRQRVVNLDRRRLVFLSGFSRLAKVSLNKNYYYIDRSGKIIISYIYDNNEFYNTHFSEGLLRVQLNKKFGFIDKTGKVIIPLIYHLTGRYFSNGVVFAILNGKRGIIDKTGNFV